MSSVEKIEVAIWGATGFGGLELIRLLHKHPEVKIVLLGAMSSVGSKLSDHLPTVTQEQDLRIGKCDPASLFSSSADVVFISVPTGQSNKLAASVDASIKVIDLGGDHRFVEGWTYGLADIYPDQIRMATRVANPGCYPTAVTLPLIPLLRAKAIKPAGITTVAISGWSGAGRGSRDQSDDNGRDNDLIPYSLPHHPHEDEIVNILDSLGYEGSLTFSPVINKGVARGILAISHVHKAGSKLMRADDYSWITRDYYCENPFIRIGDETPTLECTNGSNLIMIRYVFDEVKKQLRVISAIDNLIKGAAGQAIQNFNLMFGFTVTTGLMDETLVP